jgi:septal ring factor EnvC (AmiA/AmiB activator)
MNIKTNILKRIFVLFVIGYIIIIIKNNINKNTHKSSIHKKLNDVTNKINTLERKIKTSSRAIPTSSRALTKTESELIKAREERDRDLEIIRKQRLSYSNHDYNSLQNRLQARIRFNNIKKMENSFKKKYPNPT